MNELQKIIQAAWFDLTEGNFSANEKLLKAIDEVIYALDSGELRIASYDGEKWHVNSWLKQAILLYFKMHGNEIFSTSSGVIGYDKVPLKCSSWSEDDFKAAGFRMVPGAVVRRSAFIGKDAIVMPSFINVGAYIGEKTMVDTWATVGSCAQIGSNCHLSGGVGIGGVLEPLQANPVIIEDDVFVGARSEVVEGVIVEKGSVLSMGVYIGASTRIYDRQTGEIIFGRIPAYSVVVPGTLPDSTGKVNTYAAIIVKKVDANTRAKTSLNEILRGA
jgi:2,3,4,5-tetrahydropyridine-2-carboxylate N-succinyltransferase